MAKMPSLLKNFNVFYQGGNCAGETKTIKLPTLKRKLENWRGGGMNGSAKADMGLDDDFSMEHVYGGFKPEVFSDFGSPKLDGVMLRFVGACQRDDTGAMMSVEVVMRGRHEEIEPPEGKGAEGGETKVKTALNYYKLTVDGKDLIEIDILNMIETINGTDLLAEHRRILGL